jgi:hypothetical protein
MYIEIKMNNKVEAITLKVIKLLGNMAVIFTLSYPINDIWKKKYKKIGKIEQVGTLVQNTF